MSGWGAECARCGGASLIGGQGVMTLGPTRSAYATPGRCAPMHVADGAGRMDAVTLGGVEGAGPAAAGAGDRRGGPLAPEDRDYPPGLLRLPSPPLLYVRGGLGCLAGLSVGVVGTRRPDAVQRAWSAGLAAALAARGITVCSGYAPGIDRAAHRGALAGDGATAAVLAEPVGVIRRRGEGAGLRTLTAAVLRRGCFVSEQAPGGGAASRREAVLRLLARNRLIAALSGAVVVVAARDRGGAHVTAEWAWRLGIPVFVADFGSATPIGNLRLILRGAIPLAGSPDSAAEAIPSSLSPA
jgi:DNA processing protein